MDLAALLTLPDSVRITSIVLEGEEIVVAASSEQSSSCCPVCGQVSLAIHSIYQRLVESTVKIE